MLGSPAQTHLSSAAPGSTTRASGRAEALHEPCWRAPRNRPGEPILLVAVACIGLAGCAPAYDRSRPVSSPALASSRETSAASSEIKPSTRSGLTVRETPAHTSSP